MNSRIRNIDPGVEQVHSDHHPRINPIAELPDPLPKPIYLGGDLLDKGITLAEHIPGNANQAVGMRGRSLTAKIKVLENLPYLYLMLQGIRPDLFDDLKVESGAVTFCSTSGASN